MIIDLTKLINGTLSYQEFYFDDYKYDYSNKDILDIEYLKVKGYIKRITNEIFDINMEINAKLVLPCSITLKRVDFPLKVKINGNLEELLEEIGEKIENRLDIFPIVWENVLMEIPFKVVSEDAHNYTASGDGWKLVSDEDEESNNPFASLKEKLEKKV